MGDGLKKIWILFIILCVILVSGCVRQDEISLEEQAKSTCIDLCEKYKDLVDYTNGPCISDNSLDWEVEDWVCDVAHSPRQNVDNLPENQCIAFRNGEAHHFVEVDPDCNFIKAV